MKLEALKHQGVKSETGSDAETADLVGKEAGDSGRKVQRYIRLTELLPELLELVDRVAEQKTVPNKWIFTLISLVISYFRLVRTK